MTVTEVAVEDAVGCTEEKDETLAQRASWDFEAFGELYRRYMCKIYRFVRSQVPHQVAEDLTAQIFFKALKSADTFRGDSKYQAWIFRIARNTISTSRRHKREVSFEPHELPEAADPSPSPATQVVLEESRRVLTRTVSALPPAQREVVALRYLSDMSIDEVAQITSRSRGAVRILLHRARLRLRHALEGKDLR